MTAPQIFALLLQGVPPQGLVVAMLLSYALGFAGMLLAYLNYKKRHRNQKPPDEKGQR